jgi:hypothetical protein
MFEKEAERKAIETCPSNLDMPTYVQGFINGAEFVYANEWHKLDWEKDFPEADKLIRVRLRDGMEHICETCYYEPTEDEIGYGKLVISFYELNGEWVDDNDVIAWCYIKPFKESE